MKNNTNMRKIKDCWVRSNDLKGKYFSEPCSFWLNYSCSAISLGLKEIRIYRYNGKVVIGKNVSQNYKRVKK